MYARCTVSQATPDTVDQAVKLITDEVIPLGRELRGFKGVQMFVDRQSGRALTFTLWETEEDRQASAEWASRVRSDVMQKLSGTVAGVENYELVIDER